MRRAATIIAFLCVTAVPAHRAGAQDTQAVFDGLAAICADCHSTGNLAYFVSIEAFRSLVAGDPRLVSPGAPDDSELVRLLEGNGTGAFDRMPIGGPTYQELVEDGVAPLSIQEIRDWVTELDPADVGGGARPDGAGVKVRRMSATLIHRTLYQQLGLGHEDFFEDGEYFGILQAFDIAADLYPLQPADAFPTPDPEGAAQERFFALGGGSAIRQVRRSSAAGPTFVLTLTQVSQAWCRFGLEKNPNEALLPGGANPQEGDEATVKATLRRWHLHFWGVIATDTDVDNVYDNVFEPLAAMEGPLTAHVGACSYFIRHPHWIFY